MATVVGEPPFGVSATLQLLYCSSPTTEVAKSTPKEDQRIINKNQILLATSRRPLQCTDHSIEALKNEVLSAVQKHGAKLVALDYLQLIRSNSEFLNHSRSAKYAYIASELKSLALGLNIPILLTANMGYDDRSNNGSMSLSHHDDLESVASICDSFCQLIYPLHFFEEPCQDTDYPELLVIKKGELKGEFVRLKYNSQTWSFENYVD